jgi:uncharacterized protein YegP (UPF0339 family)
MKKVIVFVLMALTFWACEEVISVPDISDNEIEILAPLDGVVVDVPGVAFSWEEIEFADQYEVQIATPSFSVANQIVLDTILRDSTQILRRFEKALIPNQYEWRIRAANSDYETAYSRASFEVTSEEQGDDISDAQVQLIAPSDSVTITSATVNFTWDAVDGAESYTLQVATPDFQNPIQVVVDEVLTTTSFQTVLTNGEYQWRVKAVNESSETDYSVHSLTIDDSDSDDISDAVVVLLAPSDNAALNTTEVSFTWQAVTNATQYELQVASPDFNNPQQFVVNERFDNATTQTYTLNEGSYEWRVKAINDTSETEYTTNGFTLTLGDDLSTQNVSLLAPTTGTVLDTNTINFTWDALQAATDYRIQIATPNFTNPIQVVVDQVFNSADTQSLMLSEGDYEWRVKAINASSESPYSVSDFTVDFNAELSDQSVVIISPIDGFVTSNTSVNLQWEELAQATLYRVIITDESTGEVFLEQTTASGILGVTFISGSYSWKVRAENASQNTPFTEQSITIL